MYFLLWLYQVPDLLVCSPHSSIGNRKEIKDLYCQVRYNYEEIMKNIRVYDKLLESASLIKDNFLQAAADYQITEKDLLDKIFKDEIPLPHVITWELDAKLKTNNEIIDRLKEKQDMVNNEIVSKRAENERKRTEIEKEDRRVKCEIKKKLNEVQECREFQRVKSELNEIIRFSQRENQILLEEHDKIISISISMEGPILFLREEIRSLNHLSELVLRYAELNENILILKTNYNRSKVDELFNEFDCHGYLDVDEECKNFVMRLDVKAVNNNCSLKKLYEVRELIIQKKLDLVEKTDENILNLFLQYTDMLIDQFELKEIGSLAVKTYLLFGHNIIGEKTN